MSGELTAPCGLHRHERALLREGLPEAAQEFERLLEEHDVTACGTEKGEPNPPHRDYATFRRVLRAMSGLRETLPCAEGGCAAECPVRRCTRARGIAGCWECRDVDFCAPMRHLRAACPAVDGNHDLIWRYGVRGWSTRRRNPRTKVGRP